MAAASASIGSPLQDSTVLTRTSLIYPFLMSRAVSLHPAVVVFALFVLGLIFGFAGLALAIPLAAVPQVLVRRLWIEEMDRAGVDHKPPPKPERGPGLLRRALGAVKRR